MNYSLGEMGDMDTVQTKCSAEQKQLVEKLFKAEYENMVAFANHILGDFNLADVAVQDTFLIALQKPDKLFESPNPTGWLYNTIKHVILHIERDRNYLYKRNVSLYDISAESASYEDTYSEISPEVRQSDEWKLLTLFYIEGYSIRELAKKYDISEDACKSRLKRAREKLRNQLG